MSIVFFLLGFRRYVRRELPSAKAFARLSPEGIFLQVEFQGALTAHWVGADLIRAMRNPKEWGRDAAKIMVGNIRRRIRGLEFPPK